MCIVIEQRNEEIRQLRNKNAADKIFLNMIIHDIRNPTMSQQMVIELIKDTLSKIDSYQRVHQKLNEQLSDMQVQA